MKLPIAILELPAAVLPKNRQALPVRLGPTGLEGRTWSDLSQSLARMTVASFCEPNVTYLFA